MTRLRMGSCPHGWLMMLLVLYRSKVLQGKRFLMPRRHLCVCGAKDAAWEKQLYSAVYPRAFVLGSPSPITTWRAPQDPLFGSLMRLALHPHIDQGGPKPDINFPSPAFGVSRLSVTRHLSAPSPDPHQKDIRFRLSARRLALAPKQRQVALSSSLSPLYPLPIPV